MLIVIDDNNWRDHAPEDGVITDPNGEHRYAACLPRQIPVGRIPCASAAPFDLIPRNEWKSRANDLRQANANIRAMLKQAGIRAFDQQRTSTCHAQSAAMGLMCARIRQGEAPVVLSPGSIAGPVTGYLDAGAYIEDDLQQIVKGGAASVDFVPPNQISRAGWKPGAEANALLHRAVKWLDLGANDSQMIDRCATQLLLGNAVCVAFDWWGHAVTLTDVYDLNDFEFLNSWGTSYSENGYGRVQGWKAIPNAAYVCIAATANMI